MTTSRSTERLQVLTEALTELPTVVFDKLKSFSLTWVSVNGEIMPVIQAEFNE